jgi:hypothetical protein
VSLRLKLVIVVAFGLSGLTILYLWQRRELAASQVLDSLISTGTDRVRIRRIGLSYAGHTREFSSPPEIASARQALRFCRMSDHDHQAIQSKIGTLTIETQHASHDYRIKKAGDTAFVRVLRDSGHGWVVFDSALLTRLARTGTVDP